MNIVLLFVASLETIYCFYKLDAYGLADVLFHYHHYLPVYSLLSWCRVMLVSAIQRNITIFDFKQLAAYLNFLDTEAL